MWSRSEDLKAWTGVESFESVVQKLEEMASKKKQDEKNLKLLRELVSLPCNKHCFDCQQRGPTYIDMTIGSFVCTSCSGLLRGLTPPHRVKSISMASFTDEEISMLKSRGNDYCRRVWLGLYDPNHITDVSDEQHVKDFMINKYERKRYYLDPSKVTLPPSQSSQPQQPTQSLQSPAPLALPRTSNNNHAPDPFSPNNLSKPPEDNFANFDNNPIFNAAASTPAKQQNMSTPVKSSPLQVNHSSPGQDRYAALKDLDCLMRGQASEPVTKPADAFPASSVSPWGMNGSAGSMFDSPQQLTVASPMFLSPESTASSPGNPFVASPAANNNPWGSATPPSFNQQQQQQPVSAFPRTNPFDAPTNGMFGNQQDTAWAANFQDTPSFGSAFSPATGFGAPAENNNKGWNFTGNNFNNPFTLGGSGAAKSSNPFL